MNIAPLSAPEFFARASTSTLVETLDRPSSLTRLSELLSLPPGGLHSVLGAGHTGGHFARGMTRRELVPAVSWESLSRAVTTFRFPWPRLRLVQDSTHLPPSSFLKTIRNGREGSEVIPRGPEIANAVRAGATLVLDGIEQFDERSSELATDISFVFGTHPTVNAYWTPPGATGFDLHCDDHDVLVLQLEGTKRWRVWPPTVSNTIDTRTALAPQGPPPIDLVVGSNEWVWIPRGWWHAPTAEPECHSLHLSVAIDRPTIRSVLDTVVDAVQGDRWRQPARSFAMDAAANVIDTAEISRLAPIVPWWWDASAPPTLHIPPIHPIAMSCTTTWISLWRRPIRVLTDERGMWTAVGGLELDRVTARDAALLRDLTGSTPRSPLHVQPRRRTGKDTVQRLETFGLIRMITNIETN